MKYYGVNINKEEFIIKTDDYYSAVEFSEYWFKKYHITAVGREEDFIWIAAWVLWTRLIEDKKCYEEIEQKMFNGYECLENNKIKEFIKLLPESKEKTIQHLRRAEAETYFYLGESEKGEQKFKQIIKDYPNWAWGYIGWGDQYSNFARKDLIDKEKSRKIKIYL